MKKILYTIMITCLIIINFSFLKIPSKNVAQPKPIETLISLHTWGTTAYTTKTGLNGVKEMKISFANNTTKVFYVKTTSTTKIIYETTGIKRAIILDNSAQTVTVTENGVAAIYNDKTYQDITVAAAIEISGTQNHLIYTSGSARCTHTFVAVYLENHYL